MKEKITNHPGLQNFGGYCYGTVESYEQCINDLTDEMQPYYDEAGKDISNYIDNNLDSSSDYSSYDSSPSYDDYSSLP